MQDIRQNREGNGELIWQWNLDSVVDLESLAFNSGLNMEFNIRDTSITCFEVMLGWTLVRPFFSGSYINIDGLFQIGRIPFRIESTSFSVFFLVAVTVDSLGRMEDTSPLGSKIRVSVTILMYVLNY